MARLNLYPVRFFPNHDFADIFLNTELQIIQLLSETGCFFNSGFVKSKGTEMIMRLSGMK